MIKTKSIYAPAGAGDGFRLLITRFYPRGMRRGAFDAWSRDLAPSRGLLRRYRDGGVKWEEFMAELLSELRGNKASGR